jgi:hypothetical protein
MNYQRQQLQIVPECSKNFIQNEIRRRNSNTICRFHEQEDDSSEKPNRTRPRSVGRQLLRRRIQKEMLAERSDPHLTMNEQFLNVRDSDATSFPILSPSQLSLSLSVCVCVCVGFKPVLRIAVAFILPFRPSLLLNLGRQHGVPK